MKDRIPTPGLEGRLLITPEDGSPAFYARAAMADNPTELGTPFATATMLTDETAALYGLDGNAVPNDVLSVLSKALLLGESGTTDVLGNLAGIQIATGSYVGTGTYGESGAIELAFDFAPKFVFVQNRSYIALDILPLVHGVVSTGANTASGGSTTEITVSWLDNGVSWYGRSKDAVNAMKNTLNSTYFYIAIG